MQDHLSLSLTLAPNLCLNVETYLMPSLLSFKDIYKGVLALVEQVKDLALSLQWLQLLLKKKKAKMELPSCGRSTTCIDSLMR